MKNQAPELERQRCGVASKDKRVLVLFLFGALILMGELPWPHKELPHQHYALQQRAMPKAGLVRLAWQTAADEQYIPLEPEQPIADTIPARFAFFLQQPMPINRSDQESLQLLPGVGPHLARAMSQYIQQHGPLTQAEELLQVTGIGPKTLERLRPYIRLGQAGAQP